MQFKDVIGTFEKWLLLPSSYCIEIPMAVIADTERGIKGDPIWIFIKARSGGAKSEIIRSMESACSVEISNLTPRTFISGRTKSRGGDLLTYLNGKCLLMKDFTVILQKNTNDRAEILSQLRGMYDGKFTSAYGSSAGVKEFNTKFNLIAGVTHAIERYTSIQGILGERFLMIDTRIPNEAVLKAAEVVGSEDIMRRELSTTVEDYLIECHENECISPNNEIRGKMVNLAQLLATLRTGIPRNLRGDVDFIPEPELGTRIIKQLVRLFEAISLIRPELTHEELYERIKQVAIDSIPERRLELLQIVRDSTNDSEKASSTEIANIAKLDTSYTTRILNDLFCLKVIDRMEGSGKTFWWKINEQGKKYLGCF